MKNSVPHGTMSSKGTYTVLLLIKHEGSDSPPGIGASTSLTADTNGSPTPAVLVLSTRNGASRHQHDEISGSRMEVEITKVVDGGTTSQ